MTGPGEGQQLQEDTPPLPAALHPSQALTGCKTTGVVGGTPEHTVNTGRFCACVPTQCRGSRLSDRVSRLREHCLSGRFSRLWETIPPSCPDTPVRAPDCLRLPSSCLRGSRPRGCPGPRTARAGWQQAPGDFLLQGALGKGSEGAVCPWPQWESSRRDRRTPRGQRRRFWGHVEAFPSSARLRESAG